MFIFNLSSVLNRLKNYGSSLWSKMKPQDQKGVKQTEMDEYMIVQLVIKFNQWRSFTVTLW